MVPVTTKPASSALTIPAHTSKDYSYFEPSKPIQIVTTDLERKKKRFTSINPNLLLLPFQWVEENAPSFRPQVLVQKFSQTKERLGAGFCVLLYQACDPRVNPT